ncbi:hypothetical protein [Youxingia wuxianensis]|uniref:Uncharacterized protein n=1 Tax=Youxingia wuxianensis TaxID=2763678 RepID=A0A926ENX3_9FIRM|nr:hypothetical protein [Youxingia wuxianensis]MBC8586076.1 hypothetical protein [Youxingia wuxianensis]
MNNFSMEKSQNSKPVGVSNETREVAEVKAQIFLAKQFPRDTNQVISNIMNECQNPRLAETAQYSYVKGKGDKATEIKGPSIRLMEVITRNWGNCDSSLIEVERRKDSSTVKVRFWDFETNSQQSKTFDVNFIRNTKNGSYMVTDEREQYEMMANYGARRLRACMQAGIPSYVVDQALEVCEKTLMETVNKGKSIEDTRKSMLDCFQKLADWITPEMLGGVVNKDFDGLTTKDIVKIKSLYNAIKDGFVKPEEAFGQESGAELPSMEEQEAAEKLNEQLGL